MNLFPYSGGHVMVAPKRHVGSLAEATAAELAEMMSLARQLEEVFREEYQPDGINVGMNLGRPAGAGVADHIHLHIVPALDRRHELHDRRRRAPASIPEEPRAGVPAAAAVLRRG